MDRFNALSYGNNDGPEDWAANWSENDAGGGGATGGNVQVINGSLRMTTNGSWAARTADLTTGIPGQNFTSATLSLNFRTNPNVDAPDAVVVEISSTGGAPFTILETITGIAGQTSATRSYDISALHFGKYHGQIQSLSGIHCRRILLCRQRRDPNQRTSGCCDQGQHSRWRQS